MNYCVPIYQNYLRLMVMKVLSTSFVLAIPFKSFGFIAPKHL